MISHAPVPTPEPRDLPALAQRFRLPIADLAAATPQAVALLPERWARRFHVVPVTASASELTIAASDPLDLDCERTLGFATGRHVRLALAPADDIARRLDELYGDGWSAKEHEAVQEVEHIDKDSETAPPSTTDGEPAESSTTTQLVDDLLPP